MFPQKRKRKDKRWPALAKPYLNLQKEWYTNVKEVGLSKVDDAIVRDFVPSTNILSDILHYLNSLNISLKLSSIGCYKETIKRLNNSVITEDSETIEGIEILISKQDFNVLEKEVIDLSEQSDLQPLINEVDGVLNFLTKFVSDE